MEKNRTSVQFIWCISDTKKENHNMITILNVFGYLRLQVKSQNLTYLNYCFGGRAFWPIFVFIIICWNFAKKVMNYSKRPKVSSQKTLLLKSHSFIHTRHFQFSAYQNSDFYWIWLTLLTISRAEYPSKDLNPENKIQCKDIRLYW